MNITDLILIAVSISFSIVSIMLGKKQAGAEMKGLSYLLSNVVLLILGFIAIHIQASRVAVAIWGIVFCTSFVISYYDFMQEKRRMDELKKQLQTKLEKARRK